MGGAVSSGRDNNELVDNLMGGGYIRTRTVERVFRVLDRADYMIPHEREQAYKDLAWRSGALHLSAPCIYSEVLEALELKPGLSFLNLGSGTGYLSALVGLIIGSGGISHGVEVHPGVIEYSTKKLRQLQENSVTLDEFDFCIPKFYCGNALCLAPLQTQYDRVYVGAGVLTKYENYFKQMIKVGGILVMPLGETLVQIHRISETEWISRHLLNVSFALLRAPTNEEVAEPMKLDELVPVSLMLLCRGTIRRAMLGGVCRRHPELREPVPCPPAAAQPPPRRICIPLDSTQDPNMHALHDIREQEGGREMNALLSLVLSMGNNRVAGSLRFGDERDITNARNERIEVLIDGINNRSDSSSSDGGMGAPPSPPPRPRAPPPPHHGPPAPPGPRAYRPEPPMFPGAYMRPSSAGAANASEIHPTVSASMFSGRLSGGSLRCDARGVRRAPAEPAPGAAASGTDLTALNPAGRVEVDDYALAIEPKPTIAPFLPVKGDTSDAEDSKPSTSGESPAPLHPPTSVATGYSGGSDSGSGIGDGSESGIGGGSGGGSGGAPGKEAGKKPFKKFGKKPDKKADSESESDADSEPRPFKQSMSGAGEGGPGAPRLQRRLHVPTARSKRHLRQRTGPRPQVQIFFGNAGSYDGDDVVLQDADEEAGAPPANMDGDTSSSDDQADASSKDKKRLKLDRSNGECSFSTSEPQSTTASTDASASASASTSASASASANDDAHSEGGGESEVRGGVRGGVSRVGRGGQVSAEELLRRRSTSDARRVRLSVVMKRAIKELPLPYALKKFVNLYRCFEF